VRPIALDVVSLPKSPDELKCIVINSVIIFVLSCSTYSLKLIILHIFQLLFYWIFWLWNLVFFVNTCICEYGAKFKFEHSNDKGGYPKISKQKGEGDSSITE